MRTARVMLSLLLALGILACPLMAGPDDRWWILVGGANPDLPADQRAAALGLIIVAEADTPTIVTPDLNRRSEAQGEIVNGPECRGGNHFHGALFGTDDGGAKCGWGVAVDFESAPLEVSYCAEALDREVPALYLALEANPPDFVRALFLLSSAQNALRAAKQGVSDNRNHYKGASRAKVLNQLTRAQTNDKIVEGALRRLRDGNPRDSDLETVRRRLNQALKAKRDAFEIMVGAHKLLRPPRQ